MNYVILITAGLAVFGLLLTAMWFKEKRAQAKPSIDSCHQIHPCQCKASAPGQKHKCREKSGEFHQV